MAKQQFILSGTTDERPTVTTVGFRYFDTTIGRPLWWGGDNWVDYYIEGSSGMFTDPEGRQVTVENGLITIIGDPTPPGEPEIPEETEPTP